MAFAPGDVVQLKSGSPALTVTSAADDEVSVIWYAEEVGEFRTRALPIIALEALDIADFETEEEEEEEDDDEDQDD